MIIKWLLQTAVNNRIWNGTNKPHNRFCCNYLKFLRLSDQSDPRCSENRQNKVNLHGHWASWKDCRTTWLQPVFSAQPALTVITEWECERSVCGRACLYSKCVESGAGSPDKAWGEAPWREVWVEGRATAETTFQIKATSLWGVQVSTQLHFHQKKLKMQMHSTHSNCILSFLSPFECRQTAEAFFWLCSSLLKLFLIHQQEIVHWTGE